ncbi:MAG: hypothetical protein AAF676_06525 [Pseudomonadota bacterium]
MAASEKSDWLPLAEAAARLGVSRLKLREAVAKGLIPSRKDNLGLRRVDLSAAPADIAAAAADVVTDPTALVAALFDEIEELHGELDDRTATVARFADLAGRQQDALEAAAVALERSRSETARLAALLDRALDLASAVETRPSDPVSDRALALLEETTGALEESRAEARRLSTLVAKAVDLAEKAATAAPAGGEAGGIDGAGLRNAAEKALRMLETTAAELERSRAETAKATDLLGRATAAAAALEAENARLGAENARISTENARLIDENQAQNGLISAQEGMVDKLFSLSESALEAAAQRRNAPKKGLMSRVFGRKTGLSR